MTSIRSLGSSTTAHGRNAWCISSLDTIRNRSTHHQLDCCWKPEPTLTLTVHGKIISDELGADVPGDDDVLVPVASQARKSRVLCAQ
jgi:hypothetical protein